MKHEGLLLPCEISGSHGGEYEDGCLSGLLRCVVWYKFTDVSELLAASIIRARSVVLSVTFYQATRRNIPEDSHFHTRRLENL
jgi:hypothetical protein